MGMFSFDKGICTAMVLSTCDSVRGSVRFDATDACCRSCGGPLEVHYCESRVYVVRCKACEIVTMVMAHNPKTAAEIVGNGANALDAQKAAYSEKAQLIEKIEQLEAERDAPTPADIEAARKGLDCK